ncbi:O-antigen ligase family protein [candidate division FCPU426 bacterium]|nr:O-antigen ligase family protein [candidate division FCPU426 bacterium]
MTVQSTLALLRLQRFSLWALAVFAFFAVASIAMHNFIFLAIGAWMAGMFWKRDFKLAPTPMNWPLLLLAAVLVAASLWAGRMNPSIFGLRKVVLMAAFFLTAALVTHPCKAKRLLNLFLLGAVVCAVWSVIAHLAGWDEGRAQSFSGDYMAAGGMYMLAFILTTSEWLYAEGRKRWFWLACSGIVGLALLFTYTRSSWIGAAVALFFLGCLRDWRLPVTFMAAGILFLVLFPHHSISQRVFTVTSKHHSSNVERRYMWASALKLIKAQPLQGYGVDNLSEAYGRVANPLALEQRPPHVHNTLLQMAINGGLPAAGFYLWWIVTVIVFGLQKWNKYQGQNWRTAGMAVGITAAFIAFVINGLFEFNFGTSQVITIVYFLTGLLPAAVRANPADPEWILPKNPRLLFLRPRFRGDVLMASILPRLVKRDFPRARVDLLTEPASVGAAGGQAGWDRIISLARDDLRHWWRTIMQLRRSDYDAACDLFGNPRTALMVYFSGAKCRIGPQVTGWDLLFHIRTSPEKSGPRPAWESYFDILRAFGMKKLSLRPRWEISEEDQTWIKSFLKERRVTPGKVVGLFPGGSHPAKRWPLYNYLEIARQCAKKWNVKSIFIFGPLEKDLKMEYMRAAGKLSLSAEGLPPGRLAALWSCCAAVISNDAFPMHLGPAVNTPTIGLFGPGDPRVWFPYNVKNGHKAIQAKTDCWPCHRDACDTMKCWEAVTPRQVMAALDEIMHRK